jgi:hypothetical protein
MLCAHANEAAAAMLSSLPHTIAITNSRTPLLSQPRSSSQSNLAISRRTPQTVLPQYTRSLTTTAAAASTVAASEPPSPPPQKKTKAKRPSIRRPLKPCLTLNPSAKEYLSALLSGASSNYAGVILKLDHSKEGQPRMVYSFGYINDDELAAEEKVGRGEVVNLLLDDDEEEYDKKMILYVHETAFMKLLGCTLDYDFIKGEITFTDKGGNLMDANRKFSCLLLFSFLFRRPPLC